MVSSTGKLLDSLSSNDAGGWGGVNYFYTTIAKYSNCPILHNYALVVIFYESFKGAYSKNSDQN